MRCFGTVCCVQTALYVAVYVALSVALSVVLYKGNTALTLQAHVHCHICSGSSHGRKSSIIVTSN